MKIRFLGGADEVGASCLVVETARHRVLVDAGVRMGGAQMDRLPDLSGIADAGGVDEILVTHAHLDHTGALPLVHGAFPRAPVRMTEPTLGLLRVLLQDALKVMDQKAGQEGEIPLYPPAAVEALLARAQGVRFLEPVPLCDGALRATFYPAGHVLGAASVGIETPEGNLLVTGDVSLTDQLTISGMPRPRFRPDVVVCESTYGARLHASRRAEEQRLEDTVLSVLRDGGKVLIPAFALGRAQEVLLVLRRLLAREGAPLATVHADGMVRAICAAYAQYAEYLSPSLRDRARAGRGLFFTADGRVRPVQGAGEREAIASGGPCVIVSSSGMLAGGPSAWYAARLSGDPAALIALTGYQDEESPGRRLLELAGGATRELVLDGRTLEARCRVATYGLSAHADGQELAQLLRALAPRDVVLVHGDAAARRGLAEILADGSAGSVHLPGAGDVVDFAPAAPRRAREVTGLGGGRPLAAETLAELHAHLWQTEPRGRAYSAAELALRWYGSNAVPADLGPVAALVSTERRFFLPDTKRPFLFRCADASTAAAPAPETAVTPGDARLEQNAALARVDGCLGPESGLYRRGAERETWTLRLYFRFPDVARERHAAIFEALTAETGWSVTVHPEPHLGSVEQLARELCAPFSLAGNPAIHLTQRRVKVTVAQPPETALRGEVEARFWRETGFALEIQAGTGGTAPAKRARDDTGRLEINLAFAEIDRAFADALAKPYRKSKKVGAEGEWIELSFVSPEVGARFRDHLDSLEAHCGWTIRIADSVDQQAVLRVVGEIVPPSWAIRRGPGLDVAGRKVKLRVAQRPADDERERVAGELEARTGFTLLIES